MGNRFDITLYNEDFFLWHKTHAHGYSLINMGWYMDAFAPKSVVDFGCGIGSYLEAAYLRKARIKGYEIAADAAKVYTNPEILPFISQHDCTKPLFETVHYLYDCVLSFETAEHIEPSGSEQFVRNMVDAKAPDGSILFTAAPPGQEGTGHINCQSREYWGEMFESMGLQRDISLERHIAKVWYDQGCPAYISSNLQVFK